MEKLEQIMKPYLDKKEEIEKILNKPEEQRKAIKNIVDRRNNERKVLEMRLEHLRDNKEREINEYLQEYAMTSASSNYLQIIKADLEKAYREKEEEILKDLNEFDASTQEEILNVEESFKTNGKSLDEYQKELNEISDSMLKQLYQEEQKLQEKLDIQKDKEFHLQRQRRYFKYEYNEQNQLVNAYKYKELQDEIDSVEVKIRDIEAKLKKISEYRNDIKNHTYNNWAVSVSQSQNISDSVKEEEIEMVSLPVDETVTTIDAEENISTNVEEENTVVTVEKENISTNVEEENISTNVEEENISTNVEKENLAETVSTIEEEQIEETNESEIENRNSFGTPILPVDDIDIIEDEIRYNVLRANKKIVVDTYTDLIKMVYCDIMKELNDINTLRLDTSKGGLKESEAYISEKNNDASYSILGKVDLGNDENSIELPCGEYINSSDFDQAVEEYYNKNKGVTYEVQGYNARLKITPKTLKKFKNELKRSSEFSLTKNSKTSKTDTRKVAVKMDNGDVKTIATVYSELPADDYISRNKTIYTLSNLFKQKNKSWISRALEKFESKEEVIEETTDKEYTKTK